MAHRVVVTRALAALACTSPSACGSWRIGRLAIPQNDNGERSSRSAQANDTGGKRRSKPRVACRNAGRDTRGRSRQTHISCFAGMKRSYRPPRVAGHLHNRAAAQAAADEMRRNTRKSLSGYRRIASAANGNQRKPESPRLLCVASSEPVVKVVRRQCSAISLVERESEAASLRGAPALRLVSSRPSGMAGRGAVARFTANADFEPKIAFAFAVFARDRTEKNCAAYSLQV